MNDTSKVEEIAVERLSDYCEFVLGSLSRVDQRRLGEIYIRGLLTVEGRRSIKQIAAEIGGSSDQSLQQFVNQSPWDPQPVRQRVAEVMADVLKPEAWILDEIAFTKHGQHSAATERQFVPSRGRVANCQLGAVAMLACQHANVPVNWRLAIPPSWDVDTHRRSRAHIPPDQRHRPYWYYQVEMLDDMLGEWGIALAPVIVDATYHKTAVYPLLTALENRGLEYLVEVSGGVPACWRPATGRTNGHTNGYANGHANGHVNGHAATNAASGANGHATNGYAPAGAASGYTNGYATVAAINGTGRPHMPPGHLQSATLAELTALIGPADRTTVAWTSPSGHTMRSQFVTLPVWAPPPTDRTRLGARPTEAPRTVLVEWALGGRTPRAYWLTNMNDRPVSELAALAKLRPWVRYELDNLTTSLGLGHHEGRSFVGWHHHVTLVSVAHAYQVLNALSAESEPIVPTHHRQPPRRHSVVRSAPPRRWHNQYR